MSAIPEPKRFISSLFARKKSSAAARRQRRPKLRGRPEDPGPPREANPFSIASGSLQRSLESRAEEERMRAAKRRRPVEPEQPYTGETLAETEEGPRPNPGEPLWRTMSWADLEGKSVLPDDRRRAQKFYDPRKYFHSLLRQIQGDVSFFLDRDTVRYLWASLANNSFLASSPRAVTPLLIARTMKAQNLNSQMKQAVFLLYYAFTGVNPVQLGGEQVRAFNDDFAFYIQTFRALSAEERENSWNNLCYKYSALQIAFRNQETPVVTLLMYLLPQSDALRAQYDRIWARVCARTGWPMMQTAEEYHSLHRLTRASRTNQLVADFAQVDRFLVERGAMVPLPSPGYSPCAPPESDDVAWGEESAA